MGVMSDLTVNASTTFANTLNAISGVTTSTNSESSTTSSDLISDFSTIMMIMLLGSMSSQSSSDTSSDYSMGMNMNQLMAPLMLTLLEQLTSKNIEEATAADVTPTIKDDDLISGSAKPSGMPAQGPITQGCHSRHIGIDIGVSIGTKIKSTMDGEVVYAGWNNEGYGNLVIVKNGKFSTYYGHLSKIPVNVGDKVAAGDVIGLSGSTGNSTGPHLHYEVRINGSAVDPTKYMPI